MHSREFVKFSSSQRGSCFNRKHSRSWRYQKESPNESTEDSQKRERTSPNGQSLSLPFVWAAPGSQHQPQHTTYELLLSNTAQRPHVSIIHLSNQAGWAACKVMRMGIWDPQPRVQAQYKSRQQGLLKPALPRPYLKKETQETHLTTLRTSWPLWLSSDPTSTRGIPINSSRIRTSICT